MTHQHSLPTLRRAFSLLFLCGMLARGFGVLREILIAQSFGISAGLDAVYLGMAIPVALTVGTGSGLIRATVPATAGMEQEHLAALLRHAISRVTLVLLPLTLLICATAPFWTRGLTQEADNIPSSILLFSALLGSLALSTVGISGIFAGIANARGNHLTVSISPLLYNILVCTTIVLLGRRLGVLALPVGILLGELSQILVHWTAVRDLLRVKVRQVVKRPLKQLLKKFWPAAAGASVLGFNLAIDRMFASTLEEGSIAALAYGDKLVNLPVGLLGTALAVPLFTRLSRFHSENNKRAFDATLLLGLRLLILGGLPAAAVMFWTGGPLIGLLLERGAFDAEAVRLTTIAFQGYAAGLAFLASALLLMSAGMTLERPWIIVRIMLVALILNTLLNALLIGPLGLFGLAIATSIVAAIRVFMMLRAISPHLLASRELWLPAMRALAWSLTILLVLSILQLVVGRHLEPTFLNRIGILIAAVLGTGLATAILWPVFLKREWRSLTALRHEAAESLYPVPKP